MDSDVDVSLRVALSKYPHLRSWPLESVCVRATGSKCASLSHAKVQCP